MKKIISLGICILFFNSFNLAKAQLILNGSFETSQINPGNTYIELLSGSTSINNWNIDSGSIDHIGGLWEASVGSRSVDVNGLQIGSISQSFTTIIGSTYCVNFDLAGNPGGAPAIKTLNVSIADFSTNFTFDITGRSSQNMGWETKTFDFIATSTTSTLTFLSLVSGNAGPAIDDVQVLLCSIDCMGTPNGTAVIDDCGECLEPNNPNFNQSCTDCTGVLNGTAVIDDCGECLEPNDPNFNQSCADCKGVPNGTAVIDDCGICLEPNDPNFNQSCADCNGVPNGTAVIDDCGICLEPNAPNFNQSCTDCNGVLNGTAVIDNCGECLEPNNPNFNQSCLDCNGVPNGTAIIDECGECFEMTDPNFNQACADCNGIPNGSAIIDDCEECIIFPNAFTPNGDNVNDFFQAVDKCGINLIKFDLQILNRWGQVIFQTSNLNSGWNGQLNGKAQTGDVYVWKSNFSFQSKGEIIEKNLVGDLTLIR